MPRKLKLRSPGTIVAIVALVLALCGTAVAVGGLTVKQKKQVGKIATKVFNKRIGSASVAHADSADTATKANSATKANTATNAEKLGNRPAGDYQIKLQGSCPAPSAIEAIGQGGEVSCTPAAVRAINMTPTAGQNVAQDLGDGLQLLTVCHDGATVQMSFQNLGSGSATLNWLYSDGTNMHALGGVVGGGGEQPFTFAGARIEGQFIYAVGATVKTVNLHAFDGGTFCEVRGTVETASS